MPSGLRRYQETRALHFPTFSCYRRQPFLASAQACDVFELASEQARIRYEFFVTGYVEMAEHVNLSLKIAQ